ncbi:MAG: ATP-binding cassette domain-containing protein [Leptospirales bacterium]|jgi:iron complex transport system ATP-binding protein
MRNILELKDVGFVRGGETILDSVSWEIHGDEHWVMIGPNGGGKSTIASFICGYQWPTRGAVTVLGERYGSVDMRAMRSRLGVFQPAQQSGLDVHHPHATAFDVIVTGADGSLARYRDYSPAELGRAEELFDTYFRSRRAGRVSFPADRLFQKLSSGERRKVLLLRVFMSGPEFLLLDEPYESLDIPSRIELEQILVQYVERHRTPTLTILHRVEEIPGFATHAILVKAGRVFAAGSLEQIVDSRMLSDLYDTPLRVGRDGGRFYCVPDGRG